MKKILLFLTLAFIEVYCGPPWSNYNRPLMCDIQNLRSRLPNGLSRKTVKLSRQVADEVLMAISKCTPPEEVCEMIRMLKEGEYRTDLAFQNYIDCMYRKAGYTYASGRVKIDRACSVFPDPYAMYNILKECDRLATGSCPREITFNAHKCYIDHSLFMVDLSP